MTRGCLFEVRRRQPLLQPEIRGGEALPTMGVERRWGREVAAGLRSIEFFWINWPQERHLGPQ